MPADQIAIKDNDYKRQVIDTLVNAVYVYDEKGKGRKFVITFNLSGANTKTVSSSDIGGVCSTKECVSELSLFFVKDCFGAICYIENVG